MQPQLILEKTVYTHGQLSEARREISGPQIAMAGRSNVGKSTLINMMAGRTQNKIAKISSTPGKTRSINYFRIEGLECETPPFLVDLPGYGYARCSKKEREKWAQLIDAYLTKTEDLRAVTVLLDCRVEPQELDLGMADYVRGLNLDLIAVLTKADKCKQRDQAARQSQWKAILGTVTPLLFSGKTGKGKDALWERFAETLR